LPGSPTPTGATHALQQGVALPQHTVVFRTDPRVSRSALYEQVVQEPPSFGRITAHECQILRGEQHRPKDAEHVTWFADRAAVDPSAVGPARCDLQLDGEFPSLVHHRGTYQRAITTVSHQRCVRRSEEHTSELQSREKLV